MSKKSESEYDSDSATISASICSNSAKSTQSSARSSYLGSTNYDSSSLRSSCIWLSARRDEQQDQEQDQNVEACATKETSNKSSSDDDDVLDKTLLDRITVDQAYINRRFYTAPLYGSKLLSSIPCALNKIDENDEYSTSGHSVHTSELTSKRSGQFAWYSDDEYVERKITPRQLEVPPKKICIREVSPVIVKPQEHIPNKRFNFQNKSFVMRHAQNAESSSVSTQIYCDLAVGDSTDDSCTVEDISEEFAAKQKTTGKKSKTKKEEKQELPILPHYVAEKAHNIPLEPNIVILDEESCSSDTSRRSSKGDAPNNDEKGFMYCCQPRNCYSRPSRSIFSALEKYFKSTSCEVSPYSPSLYRMSTDIPTPHKSGPPTSSSTSSHSDVRGQSHSEGRRKETEHNFSTTFDMKQFKEILGNFSAGVTPTRTFPIDFEDIDLSEPAYQEISFKEKASELICAIQNDAGNVEFSNPGQINRKNPASKLLFDSRRNQSTDVQFYYKDDSGCSSSELSLRSREDDTPVTDARDIKVDSDYTSYCCFCFRLFRSK